FNQLRHYKWDKRQLVNAVLYITKTGCQWRMLPNQQIIMSVAMAK
ncbi:transposase, partial [Kingella kingae]